MLQGDSKEHPRSPTPETENAALILERFATSAGSRPFRRSGPGQRSEMSEDVRNQHWDGLARLTARRELLEDIWQSLPSATIMNELIDIFVSHQ